MLGLHFFGPVPLMKLVEVVKGQKTSADIFDRGAAFIRALGKTPLRVRQDIPGFVMNRIFGAAFKEALALVEKGVVTPEDICGDYYDIEAGAFSREPKDITLFKNGGGAHLDLMTARYILEKWRAR